MMQTPLPSPIPPALFSNVPLWVLGILLGLALVGVIRLRIWLLHRSGRATERSALAMEGDMSEEASSALEEHPPTRD
ncbi:MAG: hypothetical protein HPY76_06055 [Anaerolineae bacterium]|jgi:hypothetical protein|nr:hypothetical protein [Anaerolineae bacterium]